MFQPPRDLPIACGPFFWARQCHPDARAVQRHGLDLDLHDLRLLQLFEGGIEHARLRPAAHARVDRVPVAKTLRLTLPR